MKLLLAIVIIAIIALIGSRITFLNRRLPMGFRNILLTGTEYIFIGLLLGGMGLNVLDANTLPKLNPFLLFGLSWIGFLYGLQFEYRLLKTLPRRYFSITAVQSFVTFCIVSVSMYLILDRYFILSQTVICLAALTLGSTASCTAQSAIAIVNMNYRIKNRGLLDLMRYISSVDGLFSLAFFAVALSIISDIDSEAFSILGSMKLFGISILVGAIPAVILIILSKSQFSQQEFMVFLIGIILFCGGLANHVHYSPLIAGLLCGIITANFCRQRLHALSIVVHAEKSIYIILLLIIGASWEFKFDVSLFVGIIYFLVRILGKVTGGFLATRIFKPFYNVPVGFGLGLISEGGLVIAIILNFRLLYPSVGNSLITIVVISVLASELLSPRLILAQFDKTEIPIKNET